MKTRFILFLALALGASRGPAAETKVAPAVAQPSAPVPAPASAAPVTPRATLPEATNRAARPAAAAPTPRNDSAVTPAASFESFRLITDRNIFNPNRTARRERPTEEAPPRLDVISLVGTMDSDRDVKALFDGSDTAFRKALRVGDSIDKFKVTEIASDTVTLERDGKTMSVRVGQQLRRPDGGDWTLTSLEVSRAAPQAMGTMRAEPNAPVAIPANADEVTRRMMERRLNQLKQ